VLAKTARVTEFNIFEEEEYDAENHRRWVSALLR
jgi:hypothetical protein